MIEPLLVHPRPPETMLFDEETGLDFLKKEHQPILERHLIGCCLQGSFAFDEAAMIVEADDFVLPEHAEIFRICKAMREAGREITGADLFEHLVKIQRTGFVCFSGSAAGWIAETMELEPIGTRVRYYAVHVREASVFRKFRGVASEIVGYAMRPFGPALEVIGRAESLLFSLASASGPRQENLISSATMLQEALTRIDDRREAGGKMLGIASGYRDIDKLLAGFRRGQMIVVGARPSVGKTALALNIASNIAMNGEGVLLFSIEMPTVEIADRLLAMGSGVSMHKINSTHFEEGDIGRLTMAASPSGIGGCDFYVDDNCNQSGDRMMQVVRRAIRKFGIQVVVVDYLQLISPDNPRENRNAQVGQLARKMKHIARELNVPLLCLAQLNREVENRTNAEPRLSDLRDSGEIEQHADAVILLHRPQGQSDVADVWTIDAIVAKNRNGPTGRATLAYRRQLMRFENYANW